MLVLWEHLPKGFYGPPAPVFHLDVVSIMLVAITAIIVLTRAAKSAKSAKN